MAKKKKGKSTKPPPPPPSSSSAASSPAATTASSYQALSRADVTKKSNLVIEMYETGNLKQALRQLTTLVQRHGPVTSFVALQALVLERMGRRDEALALLHPLAARVRPGDEGGDSECIKYMVTTYKIMDRLDDLIRMFERCVAAVPTDEDVALQLYFTYGRAHRFGKQQRLAMQMYKHFKNDRYLYWAAVCMLQLYPVAGPNKMLQLSEMMIRRTLPKPPTPLPQDDDAEAGVEEGSLVPQDVQVYVHTLLQQEKHADALAVLCGPLVGKWRAEEPSEVRLMLLHVLMRLEQWAEVSTITWTFLESSDEENPNADDWEYWTWFVRAEAELGTRTTDIRARIRSLHHAFPHLRGPYLAELFACRDGDGDDGGDVVAALVRAYFDRFAHKMCFYFDVEAYILAMPRARLSALVAELHALTYNNTPATVVASDADGDDATAAAAAAERRCRRMISVEQMRRCCASSFTTDECIQHAARLYGLFNSSYAHLQANMDPTERGAADDFVILCAYYLLDASTKDDDAPTTTVACVSTALAVLEHGATKSPYNFQIRLLLVRLYCHRCIGAFACAQRHYDHLKIKQIQLDSMSHYVVNDAARLAHYDELDAMCARVSGFHCTHNEEGGEMYVMAYRNHNYTKVIEFARFAQRLRASHQWAVARVEHMYAQVMRGDKDRATVRTIVKRCAALDQCLCDDDDDDDDGDNDDEKKKQPKKSDDDVEYHYTNSAPMDELVVNQDVSVLHHWGSVTAGTYQWQRRLNRPAPSTAVSSFDDVEWRDEWQAQGEHISASSQRWLRFQRLVMATMSAALDDDTVAVRRCANQLHARRPGVEIPHVDWVVRLADTCACILEALQVTSPSSPEDEEAVRACWAKVHQGLGSVAAQLTACARTVQETWRADAEHVTHMSHMLMYGGVWTCVLAQQWNALLPRKRRKVHPVVSAAIGEARTCLGNVVQQYNALMEAAATTAATATATATATALPVVMAGVEVEESEREAVMAAVRASVRASYDRLTTVLQSVQCAMPTIQPERV